MGPVPPVPAHLQPVSKSYPRRLGLTGSIGAGKSTVAGLLREAGLTVIDADALARHATADPTVLARLRERWPAAVNSQLELDRAALAQRVFGNADELAALEAIIHPHIRTATAQALAQAAQRGEPWVVQDIPLLFEKGLDTDMDSIWVVDAPQAMRLERLAARSGLNAQEALAREAAQWPPALKRERADVVIENAGTLEQLREQVSRALNHLT